MKKNIIAFLMKNTFSCWTRLKNLLGTDKKLTRRNSICCLKNQTIFFTERTDRKAWPPRPPVPFRSLFEDPLPPSTTNILFRCPLKWLHFIMLRFLLYIVIINIIGNFLIKAFSLMVLRNWVKQKLYSNLPITQCDLFNKNNIVAW